MTRPETQETLFKLRILTARKMSNTSYVGLMSNPLCLRATQKTFNTLGEPQPLLTSLRSSKSVFRHSRETRRETNALWKEFVVTLPEPTTKVRGLLISVYSELRGDYNNLVSLDIFYYNLGNAELQRHQLAVGSSMRRKCISANQESGKADPCSRGESWEPGRRCWRCNGWLKLHSIRSWRNLRKWQSEWVYSDRVFSG